MSISANIAEGSGQRSKKEFSRFVRIALNSCSEVEHHLIVARDVEAIPGATFDALVGQAVIVRKMLYGLEKMLSNAKSN